MKQIHATEAQIQRTITEFLTLAGIPWTLTDAAHVTINGVTRGRAKIRRGWPDVTAILPPDGTLLAIECKSARGKLRDEQAAILDELREAGAVVVVARSLDDVTAAIEAHLGELMEFYADVRCFEVDIPDKLVRALKGAEV